MTKQLLTPEHEYFSLGTFFIENENLRLVTGDILGLWYYWIIKLLGLLITHLTQPLTQCRKPHDQWSEHIAVFEKWARVHSLEDRPSSDCTTVINKFFLGLSYSYFSPGSFGETNNDSNLSPIYFFCCTFIGQIFSEHTMIKKWIWFLLSWRWFCSRKYKRENN